MGQNITKEEDKPLVPVIDTSEYVKVPPSDGKETFIQQLRREAKEATEKQMEKLKAFLVGKHLITNENSTDVRLKLLEMCLESARKGETKLILDYPSDYEIFYSLFKFDIQDEILNYMYKECVINQKIPTSCAKLYNDWVKKEMKLLKEQFEPEPSFEWAFGPFPNFWFYISWMK